MFEYVVLTPLNDLVYRDRNGEPITKESAIHFVNQINLSYKPEWRTAKVFRLVAVDETNG